MVPLSYNMPQGQKSHMAKYRRRPIVVEAVQFLPYRIADWSQVPEGLFFDPIQDAWFCNTLEGNVKLKGSEWIVTGAHGEIYPVQPEIFEDTYDLVEEDDARNGSSSDEGLGGDSESARHAEGSAE